MIKTMKMRSVGMLHSRHLTINYKFTSVYASKATTVDIIWLGPRAFLSSVKKNSAHCIVQTTGFGGSHA